VGSWVFYWVCSLPFEIYASLVTQCGKVTCRGCSKAKMSFLVSDSSPSFFAVCGAFGFFRVISDRMIASHEALKDGD
jgi:hypothetical protein